MISECFEPSVEIYLIRAEAFGEREEITGENRTESYLNSSRDSRINGYTNQTFTSKNAFTHAVLDERVGI